jgi:hypothetical protein
MVEIRDEAAPDDVLSVLVARRDQATVAGLTSR